MATAAILDGEERILLEHVSWDAYEALLQSWADQPLRLTYDHGALEIMSPLHGHEQYSALLSQLIEAYTEEMRIPRHSGRSTTFKTKRHQRGLEPDSCYWIQSELQMRGRKVFDIDVDPPPDLAVEVDITSSSIDRMEIYSSVGVPEVWRFDGEALTLHLLQANGTYAACDRSQALPKLLPADVVQWLRRSDEEDETRLMRGFRLWVRRQARPRRRLTTKRRRRPE